MASKKDLALHDYLNKLKKTTDTDQKVVLTLAFARAHGQTYPDQADENLEFLEEQLPENAKFRSALSLNRGWIYFDKADFPRAQDFFEKSLSFAEQQKSMIDRIKAYNGIASCFGVTGKVESSPCNTIPSESPTSITSTPLSAKSFAKLAS